MIIYLVKATETAIAENRHPAESQHQPSLRRFGKKEKKRSGLENTVKGTGDWCRGSIEGEGEGS
jgi:hypothetical protein